ncbi:MAG: aminodeoxychorismate synthase component I [Pyrinomonadaceae bacterium]
MFNRTLSQGKTASIFTISYDFGLKLEKIRPRPKEHALFPEPDIFLAVFDCLIIHDYQTGETFLTGEKNQIGAVEKAILESGEPSERTGLRREKSAKTPVQSNFTRSEYIERILEIQELIRKGDTYQTNLTQQFSADIPVGLTPQIIFRNLRNSHPAAFSAFLKRGDDFVISISPERFLKIESSNDPSARFPGENLITVSPIKGTRRRGATPTEDQELKNDLLNSSKDRAENIMIVDLLRNDIGRVCRYGSVEVESLCRLEEHPTLFHLVSTVRGVLRPDITFADTIRAVFPCGSITGAPKIRTMQIIDQLETANRGLSMGAIGFCVPFSSFGFPFPQTPEKAPTFHLDLSVAIRTMIIREDRAVFNVGGGIVIDSDPEQEFDESILKAKAIFEAINARI